MSWEDTAIHVIDFEGTPSTGIVEYGVVSLTAKGIEGVRTRLCCPRNPIEQIDYEVHGIGQSEAIMFPSFGEDWDYFLNLRQTGPLGAHYARVEDRLIRQEWAHPTQAPNFLKEEGTVSSWGPWVDSCELYKTIYPGLESYKLSRLIDQFKLTELLRSEAKELCPDNRNRYHCALYDALASALLLLRLKDEPGFDGLNIHWLLAQSQVGVKEDSAQMELGL